MLDAEAHQNRDSPAFPRGEASDQQKITVKQDIAPRGERLCGAELGANGIEYRNDDSTQVKGNSGYAA